MASALGTNPPRAEAAAPDAADWRLALYVAGPSDRSAVAIVNLRQLCETYLAGRYWIDVIDLNERPELARTDQILAIPTLVRHLPEPVRKIVGDLSDHARVVVALEISPELLKHETGDDA